MYFLWCIAIGKGEWCGKNRHSEKLFSLRGQSEVARTPRPTPHQTIQWRHQQVPGRHGHRAPHPHLRPRGRGHRSPRVFCRTLLIACVGVGTHSAFAPTSSISPLEHYSYRLFFSPRLISMKKLYSLLFAHDKVNPCGETWLHFFSRSHARIIACHFFPRFFPTKSCRRFVSVNTHPQGVRYSQTHTGESTRHD